MLKAGNNYTENQHHNGKGNEKDRHKGKEVEGKTICTKQKRTCDSLLKQVNYIYGEV